MTYLLKQTDHGIDGFDAKTKLIGVYGSVAKAVKYLQSIGYDYIDHDSFASQNEAFRNCMGQLTYSIESSDLKVNL